MPTATPSTTTFRPGELVLVTFPFTGGVQAKLRPALVILDAGDADLLLARVTTQPYGTRHDVVLADWRGAGLLAPSVVRLHKLATLDKLRIHRRLGALLSADRRRISVVMRQIYGRW
jgi:mRNA interferase MazF